MSYDDPEFRARNQSALLRQIADQVTPTEFPHDAPYRRANVRQGIIRHPMPGGRHDMARSS